MGAFARPKKSENEARTLLASALRLATDPLVGSAVRAPVAAALAFVLDVTTVATDGADTLDVFVQTQIGEQWIDVVHFTQVVGNAGAKRHVAKLSAGLAEAMFETGSALAAGSVRHLLGDAWRARWAIVDADADGGFTFSVTAVPM